ncbi:MAG: hypothetical protein P4M14_00140 [Gammaproteobacteria bacterium]|nr:hypothetical protein [Gammaproteobacteria bacterium]
MKITQTVIASLLSVFSFSCYANKVDFNLSGGAAFANLSNNSSVQINDVVNNYYQSHSHHTVAPFYGLGLGHTFENIDHRPLNLSLGVSAYYTDLGSVRGTELPFVNGGNFDTLNYHFNVQSTSLLLEPRLIYTYYAWQPYLLAGVGSAWNRLANYSEAPSDPASSASPAPFYKSHVRSAFAYEVGIGIQHAIFHDEKNKIDYLLSLDYRYMNFGKGRLTNFSGMTSNGHLGVSNINMQALVFSLKTSF